MASTSHSDSADMCSVTESPIIVQPKSIDNSDINQISIDSDFSEGEEDITLSRKDASQKSESGKLLFTRRFVSIITSVLIMNAYYDFNHPRPVLHILHYI